MHNSSQTLGNSGKTAKTYYDKPAKPMFDNPISLGVKGTPLDLTHLHAVSLSRFGREVQIGEVLTKEELAALGFSSAATEPFEKKFERKSRK